MTSTPPEDPGTPTGSPSGTPTGSTGTVPPPPPPPPPTGQGGPRVSREQMKDLGRLRRSATDRKIAGVAGGIARHLDIDPLLVRVALVVLVFFGGGGLLLYGACWLLVPDEVTGRAVVNVDERTRGITLAVVGVLAGLSLIGDSVGGWDFPWPLAVAGVVLVVVLATRNSTPRPHPGPLPPHGAPVPPRSTPFPPAGSGGPHATYAGYRPPAPATPRDPRRRGPLLFWFALGLTAVAVGVVGTVDLAGVAVPPSTYPATVLACCGLMLLVGAFWGRAGGLTALGLVAAVATAATSIAGNLDAGQITSSPATAAGLEDRYDLGAGEILLDLRDIEDLDNLDGRTLEVDVRMGHIRVLVPEDGLDVDVDATIDGAGETVIFENRRDGSGAAEHDGGDGVPELTIDAEVLFGQIEIDTAGSNR